ncbi:hypothetical protein ACLBOM_31835 [Escherichia coli]
MVVFGAVIGKLMSRLRR